MQNDVEQIEKWEEIWERHNLLDIIIDTGRSIYNWFFRRIIRNYITSDSTMLELGCGRASLSISLCSEIKKLVGIDISESALRQADYSAQRLNISNASFKLDNCTNLELKERFDFVWSQGLLEHFEDPINVAHQHFLALVPGGTALISVPYKYSYHALWYTLTRPRILQRFWPWTEQRFFNKRELLTVGKAVTPSARTFLLQPFPLGIIFLELRKQD